MIMSKFGLQIPFQQSELYIVTWDRSTFFLQLLLLKLNPYTLLTARVIWVYALFEKLLPVNLNCLSLLNSQGHMGIYIICQLRLVNLNCLYLFNSHGYMALCII